MFHWEKQGLVFDPKNHSTPAWMHGFAQAPSVVIFDNFVRIYFSCRPIPDANGQYVSYSSYIDVSRNNLKQILRISDQPILELGGLGTFDEFGIYPVSVIKKEDRFMAYYAGWTRCESVPFNVAIGAAESFDQGKTFTKVGEGPLLSYSPDEPFILSGPKIRRFNDTWYLFYIAGSKWVLDNGKPEPVYKIRLATSKDGLRWEKVNKNLIEPKVEPLEAQASPDVFFADGKYHMFFCYRYSTDYRQKTRGYRIGYAFSYDLLNWTRNDEFAGITISNDSGWDSEMVSYPHVFELDNEWYMLYLGNAVGKTGFGLAKLKDSEWI